MTKTPKPELTAPKRRGAAAPRQGEPAPRGAAREQAPARSAEERLADLRAGKARARAEKDLWQNGHAPKAGNKVLGKRKNGSRGIRAVEPAHLRLHPVPLLAEWYRRRKITEPQLRAGNRFNAELRAAHEPCVKAMDLARVRVDTSPRGGGLFPAGAGAWGSQEIVLGALDACGGITSASGSVLWHVVGLEKSILQWCGQHNHFGLHRNDVPGLLYGTLERLARHYGFRERTPEGARQDGGNKPRALPVRDITGAAHPRKRNRKGG